MNFLSSLTRYLIDYACWLLWLADERILQHRSDRFCVLINFLDERFDILDWTDPVGEEVTLND